MSLFLLFYAIAANADYLVTGDHDFSEVSDLQNTQLVSVSKFLEIFELRMEVWMIHRKLWRGSLILVAPSK